MATLPSSHGSLDGEGGGDDDAPPGRAAGEARVQEDEFDSEEFREWLQQRRARRSSYYGSEGDRGRRSRRQEPEDVSDGDRSPTGNGRGSGGGQPPPEWDGLSTTFQDWLIKARLWLATTRVKPRSQGPMILQKLSGQPFQSLKHYAKDQSWLKDEKNGYKLLEVMDTPELFGEDREEELLSSLARLTYHLRRQKDEGCRTFFTKFDDAVRKIQEHHVNLPEKYLGFLLINALNISDNEIKSMMAFTQGSILVRDVKSWCRKHEMKLLAKDVGADKSKALTTSKASSVMNLSTEEEELEEDEILAMEELWRELHPGQDGDDYSVYTETAEEDDIMDEHEAKEVLSTMLSQKKKTFMQSLRTKKAKNLARGYGQWRGGGQGGPRSQSSMSTTGYVKGGFYRMSLSEAKAKSRCAKCHQIGHWHKDPECPKNQGSNSNVNKTKEVNLLESEEAIFCGLLEDPGESHVSHLATARTSSPESPASFDKDHFDPTQFETVQVSVNTDSGSGQFLSKPIRAAGRLVMLVVLLVIPLLLGWMIVLGNVNGEMKLLMRFIGVTIATMRNSPKHQRTNCAPPLTQGANVWRSVWKPSRR